MDYRGHRRVILKVIGAYCDGHGTQDGVLTLFLLALFSTSCLMTCTPKFSELAMTTRISGDKHRTSKVPQS